MPFMSWWDRQEQERMEENDRALKRVLADLAGGKPELRPFGAAPLKGMQKRLRDEEWRLLRGEEDM